MIRRSVFFIFFCFLLFVNVLNMIVSVALPHHCHHAVIQVCKNMPIIRKCVCRRTQTKKYNNNNAINAALHIIVSNEYTRVPHAREREQN